MADADDLERVSDEVDALRAIFGDDAVRFATGAAGGRLAVDLPDGLGTVSVLLPPGYPSRARPPPPTLAAPGLDASAAEAVARAALDAVDAAGEVCVFEIASGVQIALEERRAVAAASAKVSAPAPVAEPAATVEVFHGEQVTDRGSVFQAHVARISSPSDVGDVLSQLKRSRKVASASHNMIAYTVDLPNGGLAQDADDDGESGAGRGMLFVLRQSGARNVVVVVSRWFGGVHLGPARFRHINSCARAALEGASSAGVI